MKLTKRAKMTFVILVIGVLLTGLANLNQYERKGIVVEDKGTMIIVQDEQGHLWEAETNEFNLNDEVVMTMHDRGTSSIYDDVIKNITKR